MTEAAAHPLDAVPAGQQVQRDRYGRPYIIPPAGGKPTPYTRCTTFVDCMDDKTNLTAWIVRQTIMGLMTRKALAVGAVAAMREQDESKKKKALDALAKEAQEAAGSSDKATIGTAVHSFTEALDRGEDIAHVPYEYRADLEAYQQATKGRGLRVLQIETLGVVDSLKIAGTWDRIYDIPAEAGLVYPDGTPAAGPVIGDVKTGSIEWAMLKIAMQLGTYANSQRYDPASGQRFELPPVSKKWALIVHLPAGTGTCTLVWVDIEKGWAATQVAAQVRTWRADKKLGGIAADTITVTKPQGTLEAEPAPVEHKVGDTVTVGGIEFTKKAEAAGFYPEPKGAAALALAQRQEAAQAVGEVRLDTGATLMETRLLRAEAVARGTDLHPSYTAAVFNAIYAAPNDQYLRELWTLNQHAWPQEFTDAVNERLTELAQAQPKEGTK